MYSIKCVSLSYDTRNVFSLFSVKYMGSCPLNRKHLQSSFIFVGEVGIGMFVLKRNKFIDEDNVNIKIKLKM